MLQFVFCLVLFSLTSRFSPSNQNGLSNSNPWFEKPKVRSKFSMFFCLTYFYIFPFFASVEHSYQRIEFTKFTLGLA